MRQVLRPPLIDPEVPEDQLAAWIDGHTMRCHAALLAELPLLRREGASGGGGLVLDSEYGRKLRALAAESTAATASGGGTQQQQHPWQAAPVAAPAPATAAP